MRTITRKSLLGLLLTVGFFILNPLYVIADTNIHIIVDGKCVQNTGYKWFVDESVGRIMIPVDFAIKVLGMVVEYNKSDQVLAINKDEKLITFNLMDNTCIIDGEEVKLEVPVRLINNEPYLPLRFISETIDLDVKWDSLTAVVYIITPDEELTYIDEWDRNLWNKTIRSYLLDDLWLEQDIYDAGHYLMVPLHAAFLLNEEEWQKQYSNHLKRFMDEGLDKITDVELYRLHYYYLASRFLVLAQQTGHKELIPEGLEGVLYSYIKSRWMEDPAWQWDTKPFDNGIKERLNWKLNTLNVDYSYYRAITDHELFLFGIAADLKQYEYHNQVSSDHTPILDEILETAYLVFNREIERQDDGGWLFQPGIWADHPENAYAGYLEKGINLNPYMKNNIAWDSSHSTRFPLWLTSLAGAYPENDIHKMFYEDLIRGLEKQFFNHVLIEPVFHGDGYKTTNYMDGYNGLYRWEYYTAGKNCGYGPYELSGTLTLGWWTFLNGDKINKVYKNISQEFPLNQEIVDLYVGPNTTRERNSLAEEPSCYQNGFRELIVRLAGKI